MTGIVVTGATGAMGSAVRTVAADREDVTLELLVSRDRPDSDVPTVTPDSMGAALEDRSIDVIIDFTVPEASVAAVEAARTAGVAAVVGTTGFTHSQFDTIEDAAATIPLLVASNFSRGVQALRAALVAVMPSLTGYDIEITETHHNRKRDAPSGTARDLLALVESERPDATRVHGREGHAPRSGSDIGVHARRAGSIAGEHEIMFAANDEVLRLCHRAESRQVFASGAIDAAVWLEGRSPGSYEFTEVVTA